MGRWGAVLAASLLAAAACGGAEPPARVDVDVDGGTAEDARTEPDAPSGGGAGADAGDDAGSDHAGDDAGSDDAGADSGPADAPGDGGEDAARDALADAGPRDATGTDAGEPYRTPRIERFTATPNLIDPSEASTLSYRATDATELALRDDTGAILLDTRGPFEGAITVRPTATRGYIVTATNPNGVTTASTTVQVRRPSVFVFTATPNVLTFGDATTLRWQVERATRIEIIAGPVTATVTSALAGELVFTPEASVTCVLIARGPSGQAMATAPITVNPSAPRIALFDIAPNPVLAGAPIEVAWSIAGAESAIFLEQDRPWIPIGPEGRITLAARPGATAYTLRATNRYGETTRSLTVIGWTGGPPAIEALTVTPAWFRGPTAAVTVRWSTRDAHSTELFTAGGVAVPGFPRSLAGTFVVTATGTLDLRLFAINPIRTATAGVRATLIRVAPDPGNLSTQSVAIGAEEVIAASIGSASDRDYFAFDVPIGWNLYASVDDGGGACAFDSRLELYTAAGSFLVGWDEEDGPGPCPEIDPVRDTFARNLTGGRYALSVTGLQSGPYVLHVRASPPRCGNGLLERQAGELCDDGNSAPGDGCGPTCFEEPVARVVGPGTTRTVPLSIPERGGAVVEVVMTEPGYIGGDTFVPIAGLCTAPFTSAADTRLTLHDARFTILGANNDGPRFPCSRIDERTAPYARVPAGTYYLRVAQQGDFVAIPALELEVRTLGMFCGNGVLEAGEGCDDGNARAMDGCTPGCSLEPAYEVEPNQTTATATLMRGDGVYWGAISPRSDTDLWAFDVARTQHVDIRVFAGTSSTSCPLSPAGTLQLLNSNGAALTPEMWTGGGPNGLCARIWPNSAAGARALAPGRYYVRVAERGGDETIPFYSLSFRLFDAGCGNAVLEGTEACDDGNASSGDDCTPACDLDPAQRIALPRTGSVAVTGAIVPSYARRSTLLDVQSPTFLRASLSLPGGQACGTPASPRMSVLREDGRTLLGSDVSDGALQCPSIDPRRDAFAQLGPGRYHLLVEEVGADRPIPEYTVVVEGPPVGICGNGVTEAQLGEQCDDRGTQSGDGCDGTCRIEPEGVISGPPGEATFEGAIFPTGDEDLIRIDVAQPSLVFVDQRPVPPATNCFGAGVEFGLYDSTVTTNLTGQRSGSDGCTIIDPRVLTGARVAAGTYFLRVYRSIALTVLAYRLSVRIVPQNLCGNGLQEAANVEFCDDGNSSAGDGCTNDCRPETVGVITATVGPTRRLTGTIGASPERRYYEIDVVDPVYIAAQFCGGPTGTTLILYGAAGQVLAGGTGGFCVTFSRSTSSAARLPAGRYYLALGRTPAGTYNVDVTFTRADVCADGILEWLGGEQCEDGNTRSGDGCSPTCRYEVAETWTLPSGPRVYQPSLPAPRLEVVRLENPGPDLMLVRVEIFDPTYPTCPTVVPSLGLYEGALNRNSSRNPLVDGPCPIMHYEDFGARLPPGTYHLVFRTYAGTNLQLRFVSAPRACGNGFLRDQSGECDDGNTVSGDGCSEACAFEPPMPEVEPNDTPASATPTGLNALGVRSMIGAVDPATDADYFAFTVPPGIPRVTLRASTTGACDATNDTFLTVFSAGGVVRASENDTPDLSGSRCTLIDPDRFPNRYPSLRDLPPGDYTVRVTHPTGTARAGPYTLHLQLLQEP